MKLIAKCLVDGLSVAIPKIFDDNGFQMGLRFLEPKPNDENTRREPLPRHTSVWQGGVVHSDISITFFISVYRNCESKGAALFRTAPEPDMSTVQVHNLLN